MKIPVPAPSLLCMRLYELNCLKQSKWGRVRKKRNALDYVQTILAASELADVREHDGLVRRSCSVLCDKYGEITNAEQLVRTYRTTHSSPTQIPSAQAGER